MLALIDDLAESIDRRWRRDDFSCYKFADITYEEMKKVDLLSAFKFSDLGGYLSVSSVGNAQISSEFSDLHFKLFDNGRFYVEILNWWDRDTAIHDHGFSGVLLQLAGRALNVEYEFETSETVSQNLRRGKLRLEKAFISKRGDMHMIPVGEAQKHAVVHIDRPTISLIVRTHPVDEISPQLNYFAPGLMANHAAADLIVNKKAKYFRLLSEMDPVVFRRQMTALLNESSPSEAFWLVLKLHDLLFSPAHIEVLKDWKNSNPGELSSELLTAVSLRRSSQFILERVKPRVADPDLRLTLALLATTYSREERARVMKQYEIVDLPARVEKVGKLLTGDQNREFGRALAVLHGAG